MNNKAMIRKDAHGLLVRAGGYVFRPYMTRHTYALGNEKVITDGGTMLVSGERVKAYHRIGTPFGVVEGRIFTEIWHSHGSYYGTRADGSYGIISTELCWTPWQTPATTVGIRPLPKEISDRMKIVKID